MYPFLTIGRNDATAVDILVRDWNTRGEKSPVRYYKRVGVTNEDTSESLNSPFKKDDFLIVFQSPAQAEAMTENPRTMCVDATHDVTAYGYYLLTMMVIDKYGKGLAVAWAITSRENGRVWELFAKSLRQSCVDSKPEVMMSDDDNSAWNGLKKCWPSLKHKLLCWWHVLQNVKKHCVGSKCKVQASSHVCESFIFDHVNVIVR